MKISSRSRCPADRPDGDIPIAISNSKNTTGSCRIIESPAVAQRFASPRFAYTVQVIDDGSGNSVGNGDGRIQKGEAVDLLVTVKNVGTVAAQHTTVDITIPPNHSLRLNKGKIEFGPLKPDEAKQREGQPLRR